VLVASADAPGHHVPCAAPRTNYHNRFDLKLLAS
jgi:hypothetical protein